MGKRGRGRHKAYHGFYSKAQWRFFWANPKLRRYARKKAHATPGPPIVRYRALPARKGAPTLRTLRGKGGRR